MSPAWPRLLVELKMVEVDVGAEGGAPRKAVGVQLEDQVKREVEEAGSGPRREGLKVLA